MIASNTIRTLHTPLQRIASSPSTNPTLIGVRFSAEFRSDIAIFPNIGPLQLPLSQTGNCNGDRPRTDITSFKRTTSNKYEGKMNDILITDYFFRS